MFCCWCNRVTENVDLLTIHWIPIRYRVKICRRNCSLQTERFNQHCWQRFWGKRCDWACVIYLSEVIIELFISAEQIKRERKYIAELVFQEVYMGLIVLLQRTLEERTKVPNSPLIFLLRKWNCAFNCLLSPVLIMMWTCSFGNLGTSDGHNRLWFNIKLSLVKWD